MIGMKESHKPGAMKRQARSLGPDGQKPRSVTVMEYYQVVGVLLQITVECPRLQDKGFPAHQFRPPVSWWVPGNVANAANRDLGAEDIAQESCVGPGLNIAGD
jgi:hypothetical protein